MFALFVNVDLVAEGPRRAVIDHARLTATGAPQDGRGGGTISVSMFPAASGNLNAGVGNGNGQQEQIAEAGNGDGGGVSPSPVDSGATAVSSGARLSNTSRHAVATMAPIAPVTTSTPSQYLSR